MRYISHKVGQFFAVRVYPVLFCDVHCDMSYLVDCRIEEFRSRHSLTDADYALALFWVAEAEPLIKVSGTDAFRRPANDRSGSVSPDKGFLDNPFIIGVEGKVESNLPVPDMNLADGHGLKYIFPDNRNTKRHSLRVELVEGACRTSVRVVDVVLDELC